MAKPPSTSEQAAAWDKWNAATREKRLSEISIDQRACVVEWLESMGRNDLDIIEVGCGAGWLCPALTPFGSVTATDLSVEVLARARERMPEVTFVAGDFMELGFGHESFDAIVALEVLSHIADQSAFVAKLSRMLRRDGMLMLATQNRAVAEKYNRTLPPIPGQIRKWVDHEELEALLAPHFDVREIRSITPRTNRLPWKLINNDKINPVMRRLFGEGPKRFKERLGWGWTLMALARKRSA